MTKVQIKVEKVEKVEKSAAKAGKGRVPGIPNYKAKLVVDAVREVLPVGTEGWKATAVTYQVFSKETVLRAPDDLKSYFMSKCCNYGRKPTGKSAPSELVKKGLQVWGMILKKEARVTLGVGSSDSEGGSSDNGSVGDSDDADADAEDDGLQFVEQEVVDVDVAEEYERYQENEELYHLADRGRDMYAFLDNRDRSGSSSAASAHRRRCSCSIFLPLRFLRKPLRRRRSKGKGKCFVRAQFD
jgi:hypothetical protein